MEDRERIERERIRQVGAWTRGSRRRSPSEPSGGYLVELVRRWMRENKASERLDPEGLFLKWKEVVGEQIAQRTRVVDIRRGELVVEVDSAPLLNELSTYYREEILQSLRQRDEFRGIQRIRFKPGAF